MNDTSTMENMKMAEKLITPFNFVTGITKMDNVSLGLVMVVCNVLRQLEDDLDTVSESEQTPETYISSEEDDGDEEED